MADRQLSEDGSLENGTDVLARLDLNLLKIFHLLVQEGSVTRAAMRAGRTQSAVSHALARLRAVFADELFIAGSGRMNPTARAREVAPIIRRSLEELEFILEAGASFRPAVTRMQFRLGMTDYTGAIYLREIMQEFHRQAPLARLKIVPVLVYDARSLLQSAEMDCLLIGNPAFGDDRLLVAGLARHAMLCAGWSGNPAMADLTLEQYLAARHLQISPDGDEVGVSDVALQAMGLARRVAAVVPHYLVAPQVLVGSDLVTAFAEGLVPHFAGHADIRIVPPPINLPDVRVSLVSLEEARTRPAQAWFRQCVTTAVERCERRRREGGMAD